MILSRLPSILVLAILTVTLAACSGHPRAHRSPEQLRADKQALKVLQEARVERTIDKVVTRMEAIEAGSRVDKTFDVLMLSGGGDWGVFGAAFLIGWFENQALPMPEFDYVAGISTGSLIAAYTASGKPERFHQMEQFYLSADEDFIRLGSFLGLGTRFIRNDPSLVDTSKLEAAIEGAIDDALIEELKAESSENKIVAAGAVNLDLGLFNAFDLGSEVEQADDPKGRLQELLLASSAVPAIFPPVEIDGDLYADGGASVGIPIFRLDTLPRVVTSWNAKHRGPPPPVRFWVLFNNKLGVEPTVTDLGWFDVLLRSYKITLQTTLVAPLFALDRSVEAVEGDVNIDITINWVAIPEDFEEAEADAAFVPELMQQLSELGRRMGRDPSSWKQTVPKF